MLIAYLLEQRLHERASMLRYTNIVCLDCSSCGLHYFSIACCELYFFSSSVLNARWIVLRSCKEFVMNIFQGASIFQALKLQTHAAAT